MGASFGRVVTPKSGHLTENLEFCKKRVAAVKEHLGIDVQLRVRMGGPAGQVLMVSQHKDVGEIEDMRRKLMQAVMDGKIPQPAAGMAESVTDQIWLTVD
ncbi:MAG: hypothetical protein ACK5L9_15320 [Paracoccus sp. (in: a-proteobacteria)]